MPTKTSGVRSVGDVVTVTMSVTSSSSTGAADADVTFIVTTPSGATTVAATTLSTQGGNGITRSTVGSYAYSFNTTEAGRYLWAFRSTGAVTASTSGVVAVRALWTSS